MILDVNELRSKSNRKFGQLIEYKVRNIFFKSHTEIEGGILIAHFFLFNKKIYTMKIVSNKNELSATLYFCSAKLGHKKKINYTQFQSCDPDLCSSLII